MEIIVRMMGGLGNQLFQYAYARKLAKQYGCDSSIYLDTRAYEKYKVRNFEIYQLNLSEDIKRFESLNKRYFFYDITREIYHVLKYLYYKITHKQIDPLFKVLYKFGLFYNGRKYFPAKKVNRKSIFLYGYFQDYRCFEDIEESILEEFDMKSSMSETAMEYYKKIKSSSNPIALSIRVGEDYLNSNWPICSKDYYKKGLEILESKHPNSEVFIFADDIGKVKKEFGFNNKVVYVENCSPVESLTLLKSCSDFVISNSSFSWWGAFLSRNKDKKIIAPYLWYPGVETSKTGLLTNAMEILPLD